MGRMAIVHCIGRQLLQPSLTQSAYLSPRIHTPVRASGDSLQARTATRLSPLCVTRAWNESLAKIAKS